MSERDSLPDFSLVQRARVRSQTRNGRLPSLPSLAIEILRYFREHLGAQDTLEGVLARWLPERAIEHGLPPIRISLALLVACGYLKKRTAADEHVFYRLNEPSTPHEGASPK